MTTLSTNPSVDTYLIEGCGRCALYQTPACKVHSWTEELQLLRALVLQSGLKEEFKWKQPCYTHEGHKIVIVTAFKEFAALSFFKGALLLDPDNKLIKPGENSQSARFMKFTSLTDIINKETYILDCLNEAIKKAALEVEFTAKNELNYPQELVHQLEQDKELNEAFERLSPGRKRSYIIHITGAKQAKTRESRALKCRDKILSGKGFNEY